MKKPEKLKSLPKEKVRKKPSHYGLVKPQPHKDRKKDFKKGYRKHKGV